jgi:putative redox protein
MEARVKWVEDMMFMGQSGSGHAVVMDGPPQLGGKNLGIRPMEMMLLGLGGCTSFDVMLILKRSRQAVTNCVAELKAERAETDPKVFTKIHVHFIVTGNDLNEKMVKRAVELSATKYCSASIMLAQSVEITHDYEIIDAGDEAEAQD